MDYNKLFICPKCNISYDTSIHIPRILPNCYHTICSKCISQLLIHDTNSIICPIDKKINKDINSLEKIKINEKLIEDINNKKFNTNNSKILNTELEDISIVLFPKTYEKYHISKNDIIYVKGKVEKRFDKYQVIANNIEKINY